MNKKVITGGLTLGVLYTFVFASTASAFWPFDALFKKQGNVKAETTEKKMVVSDVGPEGSRAYMTYQTLISLNDMCRKMFSRDYPTPTKVRVTPSSRGPADEKKMAADKSAAREDMYTLEFGIENKDEKELLSIYNNLKARCQNIANLTTRMQKIYKGERSGMKPAQPTEEAKQQVTRPVPSKEVTPQTKPIFNIKFREGNRLQEQKTETGDSN